MSTTALRRMALGALPVAALLIGVNSVDAKVTKKTKAVEKSNGKLAFSKKTIRVPKGKVTLVMPNPSRNELPHAIAIEGQGLDKDGKIVQPGGTSKVTATLKAGKTYTFYCPVGNHRAEGMVGKVKVRKSS